jgi:hypothetical protein
MRLHASTHARLACQLTAGVHLLFESVTTRDAGRRWLLVGECLHFLERHVLHRVCFRSILVRLDGDRPLIFRLIQLERVATVTLRRGPFLGRV